MRLLRSEGVLDFPVCLGGCDLWEVGFTVSRKPHPSELWEWAVQMVFDLRAETGDVRGSPAQ